MPLRLMEVVLPEHHLRELEDLLRELPVVQTWFNRISDQQTLVKILASVEETEHLMDLLHERFASEPWFRILLLPVAASLPRVP